VQFKKNLEDAGFPQQDPCQAAEPASNLPWSAWTHILGLKFTKWKKIKYAMKQTYMYKLI